MVYIYWGKDELKDFIKDLDKEQAYPPIDEIRDKEFPIIIDYISTEKLQYEITGLPLDNIKSEVTVEYNLRLSKVVILGIERPEWSEEDREIIDHKNSGRVKLKRHLELQYDNIKGKFTILKQNSKELKKAKEELQEKMKALNSINSIKEIEF